MKLTFHEFYVCSELARRDALGKNHRYGRQIWFGLNEERKLGISYSAIYKTIKKLADMGWVKVEPGDTTKGYVEGSRRYCQLTDKGRAGFLHETTVVESNLDRLRCASAEGRQGLERNERFAEDDGTRGPKDIENVG